MTKEVDDDFYKGEERRKVIIVHDKPAESGIKLNNILTALVLMVMSWVGLNIDRMRDDISDLRTKSSVQQVSIQELEARIDRHIQRHERHAKKHPEEDF